MLRNLFRAPIILLFALVALTSCGGGGGGGGGDGSLTFTPNQTSVSFNFPQGQTPPSQTVTVTATGQYSGNIYVGATISGQGGIAIPIPITVVGYTASAPISVASGLAVGTYTGQIQFLVCTDQVCTHQIGNSPIVVSYSITVTQPPPPPPTLQLSTNIVAANVVSGASPTQTITVTQFPQGQTTFSATVQSGSPWATITDVTASSFTVALAPLPSGSYAGLIFVNSGNFSLPLQVSYQVTAPAGGDVPLSVNPTNLTLATVEDGTATATLAVTPPSWNPQVGVAVSYPNGGPSGWLTVTPTSGGFQVAANAAALSAGSYSGYIDLRSAYPGTDIGIPVALTVGVGLVRPADVSLTVSAETTPAQLSGSVPINVVSGPVTTWTASVSNASWLTLPVNNGQTGQSLTYAIDQTALGALPDGATYTAQITITPSLQAMTPATFNVTLVKNLPQITSVGPYVQLTGQPARVILRGSGFNAVSSPANRIKLQGATMSNATLVNDTEIVATFSPLTVGTYPVSISNALGLTTPASNVVAVDAPVYAYAAVATNGSLRSLAYDPERGSIDAVNTTLHSVMNFHYSGSSWAASSVPLPAAFDAGLGQGGQSLVVTTSPAISGGTVNLLDPVTLATVQSVAVTGDFEPSFNTLGFGIPTTNDGRSWVAYASPPPSDFGAISYVTPGSLTPTAVNPPGIITITSGGPWYAMSRDGERLIITQTADNSIPMLYMNAADSVIRTNPAGLAFSTYYSVSETGNRLLLGNVTLYDGAFNTIGSATIPPSTGGQPNYTLAMNGQVTPDGSRVYVLAYRDDFATNPMVTPRVFVFDGTTTQPNLNFLGYFDLTDYPGDCAIVYGPPCAASTVAGAISIDGHTLFFGGDQKLVIAPVPSTLSTVMSAPSGPSSKRQARPLMTLWPLNIHP
jgi:hypothetical protein